MPAAGTATQSVARARALIAERRTAEARAVLAPLRGAAAPTGMIEMLIAYSYLVDANLPQALTVLRGMPTRLDPPLALAIGRMLMTCDAGETAFERFRAVLIESPALGDAVGSAAEALAMSSRPNDALAWAERADAIGHASPGLAAARLQASLELDRHREAAALVAGAGRAPADLEALLTTVAGRLLNSDIATSSLDRMLASLDPVIRHRPKIAALAAAAAFASGDAERAAAQLAWCEPNGSAGATLRHELALETGDGPAAGAAVRAVRRSVLEQPSDPDAAIALSACWLRTIEHDSAAVLRWTAHASLLAGRGLASAPDFLFDECVRWKNDASQRLNGRGMKIAHALGALAAEAVFGGKVAARNGSSFARIGIAGRHLAIALTSGQIRRTAATLFATEPGMLRWFAGFSSRDVLVDVGANIGLYSVLAAGLTGCRVIAIEPFSLNVAELGRNVAINGLQERVTVMHAAATDTERVDTLYFGQSYAGAANQSFGRDDISAQYVDRDAGRETVRGVPLDALAARGEIPFPTHVKIDVDGFEEQVIEGMRGILSDPRFQSLRMEIRWQEADRHPLVDSILAQGFTVAVADDVKNLLFVRRPTV